MNEKPTYEELEKRIRDLNKEIVLLRQTVETFKARDVFLDRVIDQSPIATWISDAEGTLQHANPALKKFLNLTDDQLVGKYNVLADPLVEQQGLMPMVLSVFEKGKTVHFTAEWDGNDIPTMNLKGSKSVSIEATMFPIFNQKKELTNVVLNWIDITKRKQTEEALKNSEANLRTLLNAIPDLVWLKDPNGIYITCNKKFERFFGAKESVIKGKTDYDFVDRELADFFREKDKAAMDSGAPRMNEEEITYADDGHRELLETIKTPMYNAKGELVGVLGIARDITDRKQAEKALRESESRFKQLAEFSWEGIVIHDNGVVLEANEQYFDMFGYRRDELLGKEGLSHTTTPESKKFIQQQINAGVLGPYKAVGKRKDGTEFPMELRVRKMEYNGRDVRVAVIRDLSEQAKAEESLRKSEERFKALHNASFGGIAIHDKGRILECNKGLSEITGYTRDELIGMDGLYLISDDTRDQVIQNINNGHEMPYEAKGVRKNGEIYPLRLEAKNIPYKGKNVRVVEFRDITEAKQAKKEKETLEEQLHQAQKMEAVGRLAGGVAHDFNNMLSVIIGRAEMALQGMDRSQLLYTDLEEIRKAGERSANLTRQLLAFARKQTVAPKVIDLNKTVTGITKMLKRLMGEDIELVWIPGENVRPVMMDPGQLDQILANLCVNARDAISDVGQVTIETGNITIEDMHSSDRDGFESGEYVMLAVSDNGCGMDSETLGNVFEPFFTTKEVGKGTGLGLAMVYGVVKQNNGFINVDTEPGQGATFTIYLPCHRTTSDQASGQLFKYPVERGHETVLLVEDELAILRMTSMMLEKLGYKVISTTTPSEAISHAQQYAGMIHLLVTDVVMPEMNGRDLAKNILSFYPDIKCLFMSGYTADVIAHHGILDEGLNFIQKPFSRKHLSAKVREALDMGKD